jgi:hypothetical protein
LRSAHPVPPKVCSTWRSGLWSAGWP